MCAEHVRNVAGTSEETRTGSYTLFHRIDQNIENDARLNFNSPSVRPEDLADVARQLEWTVEIRNVMVFPGNAASPIMRIEIEINDPRSLSATADALANAVQSRGLASRVAYIPRMPMNEIWLTFPENDGSCVLIWFDDSFKAPT